MVKERIIMNVYQITYIGDWGGGMAVVAASSTEEALNILVDDSSYYLDKKNDLECKPLQGVKATVKFASLLAEDFYYE